MLSVTETILGIRNPRTLPDRSINHTTIAVHHSIGRFRNDSESSPSSVIGNKEVIMNRTPQPGAASAVRQSSQQSVDRQYDRLSPPTNPTRTDTTGAFRSPTSSQSQQSVEPQLTAADALSFLNADREAMAERYTLPLSFDIVMGVFLALIMAILWLMRSETIDLDSPVYAIAGACMIAGLIASVVVLVRIWRKRGLRLLAWPPTSLSMACMVAMLVVPIAILTVLMLVPLVHWQAAVPRIVATAMMWESGTRLLCRYASDWSAATVGRTVGRRIAATIAARPMPRRVGECGS
ncbi:hypothetical protein JS533_013570 [Bifidobacterium amazonense]|uniref:Uncharacterized protein n=1 Tax=Bifidobacterium amazonense TaxID=2809027 RepID=A0ABS9VYY1_9BIFI|nr:hypothetical protein [Bifidobacterium amazonense]MCH9277273.1 hypothetical protein [Bifidobacterium amazonense]